MLLCAHGLGHGQDLQSPMGFKTYKEPMGQYTVGMVSVLPFMKFIDLREISKDDISLPSQVVKEGSHYPHQSWHRSNFAEFIAQ